MQTIKRSEQIMVMKSVSLFPLKKEKRKKDFSLFFDAGHLISRVARSVTRKSLAK